MRKIAICLVLLGIFFSISNINAQDAKGSVAGKVIGKNDGLELIGAAVEVEGAGIGTTTDIEGKYDLSLDPGTYNLVFSYISYQSAKVEVTVKANQVTYLNFAMEESVNELQEVVVTATVERSSSVALLIERKAAAQVSDGISSDLIRRTPDRTTSDVLKRVTGASIQEGKFAIIRGMNDRYNAGYLDGALLPSTEADRKAFAFDVVPANLLDNLQIIKAGTPDLVGDFGGGIIKINTKSVPEEFTQSITLGAQTHSLTTFKDFKQFDKFSGENIGLVSSERDLPEFADGALKSASSFPSAAEKKQFAAISQDFNNDWSNSTINALPNARLAYSLGIPFKFSGNRKLGLIFALNYANTRRVSSGEINSFDGSGQVSAFKDELFYQNITSGGILNLNYVAGKTQINFRNILNINADNNTVFRNGTGNITDAVKVQNMANLINYNRLSNSIISLKQIVGDNLFTVNASANYSNVRRRIPDYRIVNYTQTPDDENFQLALGDFFNTSTGRFASDLKEKLYGGNLELSKQFPGGSKVKTELKVGGFYQKRDRSFDGRSFVYKGIGGDPAYDPAIDLGADKISETGLFLVEKTSDDIAYYNGESTITAGYAMADQKFFNKLRAVYGVRYENADIHVFNEKVDMEVARIKQGDILPSVNLSYSISDKMNLRGAYYATVNRPEFRELAPFAFFVFDKNAEIKGNQNLQIAKLNNFDLRWELFPSGNQLVSIGGFYKTIENPVEFSIDVTQPFTTFTYENEKSARIYGLEFEFRKNLDFLGGAPIFRDISLFSNLALIQSKLTFEEGSQAKNDRPLQGQSPYVINGGLQYENADNGWFASVGVNRIGRRIAFVGVDPKFGDTRQDIYEAPRTVLDFQVGKNINRFNIKFTVGDILNQDLTYYQDADDSGKFEKGADRLMFRYTNGYTMSLNLGYSF